MQYLGYVTKNQATTVLLGQFMSYADGKTTLYDALGGNANFVASKITCTLTKGTTQTVLGALAKTGTDNDINLTADGNATFELSAANLDTEGDLILAFTNTTVGDEVILPCSFSFEVVEEIPQQPTYINLSYDYAAVTRYYAAFDGISGKVTVGDDDVLDAGTGDFSVFGWFDTFATNTPLINKLATGIGAVGWRLYISTIYPMQPEMSDKLCFLFTDGNGAPVGLSAAKPASGWHHIGASIDRDGNGVLYIDGAAVNTVAISTNQLTISNAEPLYIGQYDGVYYAGKADDIRYYNAAVTPAQAAAICNSMVGITGSGDPVPTWRMDFDLASGSTIRGLKADGFELNGTKTSGVTLVEGGVPFVDGLLTGPTGYMGKVMSNLRDLIAESPTLWGDLQLYGTDEENALAAKANIHLTSYDAVNGQFSRPFLLISRTGGEKAASAGSGGQFTYNLGGSLELRIEREIAAGYRTDSGLAETEFMNFIDGILDDMMTLSGQPGYFIVNGWEIIDGPFQFAEDRSEEYVYGIRIRVQWGLV